MRLAALILVNLHTSRCIPNNLYMCCSSVAWLHFGVIKFIMIMMIIIIRQRFNLVLLHDGFIDDDRP